MSAGVIPSRHGGTGTGAVAEALGAWPCETSLGFGYYRL